MQKKDIAWNDTEHQISFLELLLDETLCEGAVWIPKVWIQEAGGVNRRLGAKRKYELLLRIAEKHGFHRYIPKENQQEYELLEEKQECEIEALKTDCYLLGKYAKLLRESGYFDAAIAGILNQAEKIGTLEEVVLYLEKMLRHEREYDRIEEAVSPVLIYLGTDVCNNMLNVFARQLGNEFQKKGIFVEYFHAEKDSLDKLAGYMGRHFKAVIGIQTYLFQVKLADEVTYLHEKIKGPKLHLILDHPIWLRPQLLHNYSDFYVLSHDRNYVKFVEDYYGKKAVHFPIPGIENKYLTVEKKYDVTFVGSMGNYKEQLQMFREMTKPDKFLANRMMLVMRKEKRLSAEQAFEQAFLQYETFYEAENKIEVFYRMRKVIYLIMDYYRYHILKTILDSGITLDVFGDFWRDSLVGNHPNLVCHPGVSVEESLAIFAQSRLSLNVMSWHKDGYTERIANIMLGKALLVTDETTYLTEHYQNDKELLMFSLDKLEELPDKMKKLLADEMLCAQMAEAGYQKTIKWHTWEKRTEELLNFLQEL